MIPIFFSYKLEWDEDNKVNRKDSEEVNLQEFVNNLHKLTDGGEICLRRLKLYNTF